MFDSAQLTPPSLSPGLLDLPQSDGGSGSSTPPLWHTSPHRSLSPASRTQAILRGQRELMDMVTNMPESSYELSLKDLVNLPRPRLLLDEEKRRSVDGDGDGDRVTESYGRRGYGYGNRAAARSGSMGKGQQQQEGLLLKMVFPVYPGAAAAMRGRSAGNRRRQRKGEESSVVEKEWWRKRDGDSESGDSLYSSTIGGSGKSSGSSSGSSRSNSANSNSNINSIIAVR